MKKPEITIHSAETNEVITRPMTNEEFAQWQADKEADQAKQLEAENKAQTKQALLDRLGITEEEAKLLLA